MGCKAAVSINVVSRDQVDQEEQMARHALNTQTSSVEDQELMTLVGDAAGPWDAPWRRDPSLPEAMHLLQLASTPSPHHALANHPTTRKTIILELKKGDQKRMICVSANQTVRNLIMAQGFVSDRWNLSLDDPPCVLDKDLRLGDLDLQEPIGMSFHEDVTWWD